MLHTHMLNGCNLSKVCNVSKVCNILKGVQHSQGCATFLIVVCYVFKGVKHKGPFVNDIIQIFQTPFLSLITLRTLGYILCKSHYFD